MLGSHALLWWPGVRRFGSGTQTYTPLIKPCCGGVPHMEWRTIGTDVSSKKTKKTKKTQPTVIKKKKKIIFPNWYNTKSQSKTMQSKESEKKY